MNILIRNAAIILCDAAFAGFKNNSFDLIVSNLGVNNFKNPERVFSECFRVAKVNARIVLTTNPRGHMKEFYEVYEKTLRELGMDDRLERLESHINHRLSVDTIGNLLEKAGFKISHIYKDSFIMQFVNGTSFLNHFFIKYAFLEGWKSILPPEELNNVFIKIEDKLNRIAENNNELRMTIPIVFIDGVKA